jgi:thiol-disulfide isomerase/thioredoxin
MKIKLFILFIVAFNVSVWATVKQETATIVIVNSTEMALSIKSELTPSMIFNFYSTQKKNDTLRIESKSSFRLVFGSFSPDKKRIYNTFLIKSGEEVVIEWLPDSVVAISGNKTRDIELNFFVKMQKDIGSFEGLFNIIPHKRKNVDSLLYKVQELYNKRLDFLEAYRVSNSMSTEYENKIRKVLQYRQYYEFLDHCNIDRILDKNLIDNPNVKDFLEPLWSFEDSNIYLLEALALAEKLNHLDEKSYISFYSDLQIKYKGEQQDYLLFKVVQMAYRSKELGELVDNYLSTSQSEILKKYVTDKYAYFGGKGLEIIKPVYDYSKESLLYNLKTGKFISWDNLLKLDGAKYIDFWATWCGCCRSSLPHTRKLAEEIISKGGKVIYISKDENVKAWAKISRKEQLPDENSYLLLDADTTFISQKYRIKVIPKYMIIDKAGNVVNEDAPHPNFKNLKEELDKVLK